MSSTRLMRDAKEPVARAERMTDPLTAAQALGPQIRSAADEIERARRLPPALAAALTRAGVFRLCVPRTLGGSEADAATLVRIIETLAEADGSAGWVAMIGATSGLLSGYLREDVAREIYGRDDAVSGGVYAPSGQATVVDGGYRVSGQWPFASGCEHCTWLMGGSVLLDDGTPRRLPSGAPDARLVLFPAADARVVDTWTVSGLRGTGSHDIAVDDLFVPAERAVSLVTDRPAQPGPLYAFPVFGLLALGIAGVAIGVARRAVDELTRLAGTKTPTGHRRLLGERPVIQMQVAQAEAALRAARALLFETIGETWDAAVSDGEIALRQRALLRLAATQATLRSAEAVDLMYHAGGGGAVYATSPLQRSFRDIHVVTQHMMVAGATLELAGRVLLGIDTDTSML